ncbi:MAG: hypothetical protein KBG36_00010 [Candidatus Marinimicrobia bacterium]|nr:hypothetical protein [Candidatus Neomarinimicrobiota bacterium]
MIKKRILILLLAVMTLVTMALPQYYISPYEKVYDDLLYLQAGGFLRDLDLNHTPISTIQIAQSLKLQLKSDSYTTAGATQRLLIDRIAATYTPTDTDLVLNIKRKLCDLLKIENGQSYLHYGVKINLDYQNQPQSKLYPQLRTFGSLSVTKNLSITNVMTLDPFATENPDYVGKEWRGLSGYTEQAYLMWSAKVFRLTAGRSYIVFGPGRKSSLLFSSAARPLDNLKLDIFLKHLSFQGITAKLDKMDNHERYLSAHRLSFYLGNWAIGLTEAMLYTGSARNLEFAYLNPFLLYHGEQLNGPDLNGNTLGTLELSYTGRNWIAYSEFLVDDIQFDKEEPGDLEPNEVGCILGMDIADPFKIPGVYLGMEYTAITNRTYKTPTRSEWFLHRNVPIGYELGSDLDRINVLVRKYHKNLQFALEFDHIRQGEGDLNKPWDSPWDSLTIEQGYSEKFPTGVVQTTSDVGLEVTWMPDYGKYIYARLTYEAIKNIDHGNKDQKGLIVSVGAYIDLHGKIGF